MKILTALEAKTLYQVLSLSSDPRDTFLLLLFESGARVSETLTLSAQDLVGGSLAIAPLKNSKPRTVTLSPVLAAKLEALPPARWSASLGKTETCVKSLRRALCRRFHDLTLEHFGRRVNLHALRHSACSRLYALTKDIVLVNRWIGHRSMNSTLAYMHTAQADEANKANQTLLLSLQEA